MKSQAVLHLGSNIGAKQLNIQKAYDHIAARIGSILLKSSFYNTEPWGNTDQDSFVNSAIVIECDVNPFELLELIQNIETDLGRKRTIHWGPRIIDIDIIFFDNLILQSGLLTLPHRDFSYRDFVLMPLLEIIPGFIDPRSGKTIRQLSDKFTSRIS